MDNVKYLILISFSYLDTIVDDPLSSGEAQRAKYLLLPNSQLSSSEAPAARALRGDWKDKCLTYSSSKFLKFRDAKMYDRTTNGCVKKMSFCRSA